MWEGGRLRSIIQRLIYPALSKEDKCSDISCLTYYLKLNLRYHDNYFYCFVFCEFLNFINVVMQMYLVDAFLGGAFSSYGFDVLRYSEMEYDQRVDPMVRVFPRLTKCTFHKFGSSGDVQKHDALCILPLNIINEKIYIFLWFWLVMLAIISGIIMIYRLAVIFFPRLRYMVLRSRARLCDRHTLKIIMDSSKIGDWFILYLLCKNMDPINFRELTKELTKDLSSEGTRFNPQERETPFN